MAFASNRTMFVAWAAQLRHLPIYESVINVHEDELRARSLAFARTLLHPSHCSAESAQCAYAVDAFYVLRISSLHTAQCWSWFLEESESVCHLISFRSHSYKIHIECERCRRCNCRPFCHFAEWAKRDRKRHEEKIDRSKFTVISSRPLFLPLS